MDTRTMVARAKQGDAEALEQMYRAFAPKMRMTCKRILKGDTGITDDLLHDAFVLAFTSLAQLKSPDRLEQWLCAIARNVTLRYVETRQAKGMKPLSTLPEDSTHLLDATQPADAQALAGELHSIIDNLPQGYRTILRLHLLEGYSHQEISEMLGIAPHSSSSQLSRAKSALQRMMKERNMWLALALALIATPVGIYLTKKEQPTGNTAETDSTTPHAGQPAPAPDSKVAKQEGDTLVHIIPRHIQAQVAHASSATDSTASNIISTDTTHLAANDADMPTATDSVPDSNNVATDSLTRIPRTPHPDYAATEVRHNETGRYGWHIGGGGLIGSSLSQGGLATLGGDDNLIDAPTGPIKFSNWEDYHENLLVNNPTPNEKTKALMDIAANNTGDIVEREHHQRPITLGISLSRQLTYRWSIATGLQYSLLKSTFSTGTNGYSINRYQRLHYLGVPMQASFQAWTYKHLSVLANGGITVNVPVHGYAREVYVNNLKHMPADSWHVTAPWQFSCSAGISMQYEFAPHTNLYIEPTFYYHIPNGSDVHSIWTERTFMFSMPLGIRFSW